MQVVLLKMAYATSTVTACNKDKKVIRHSVKEQCKRPPSANSTAVCKQQHGTNNLSEQEEGNYLQHSHYMTQPVSAALYTSRFSFCHA